MKWFKDIVLLTLPSVIIVFLLLELIFRFVIPASEVPRGYYNEKENMYSFDTLTRDGLFTVGKFAEIRARWHINNMTWNSSIDYDTSSTKPLIAVIGDSYIEAYNVDTGKSYPDHLRKTFADRFSVYSFGKSGAPLSQYLYLSRYVKKHYRPKIIIINIVLNDFDESLRRFQPQYSYFMQIGNGPGDSLYEIQPSTRPELMQYHLWKKLFNKSAIFRYCFFNLKIAEAWRNFKAKGAQRYEGNISVSGMEEAHPLLYKATDFVIRKLKEENTDCTLLLVMDGKREAIYKGTQPSSHIAWMYDTMHALTEKHGVAFLDLSEAMEKDYRSNHRAFNSPLDGHWDEYGHAFVATQVEAFLKTQLAEDTLHVTKD